MRDLFTRLWAWLRGLFFDVGRPPGKYKRETDGLSPTTAQPAAPSQPPQLPPAAPYTPELSLETDEPPRYARSKSVLTFQERKLYPALLRAVEDRHQILAKVRMGDFVYLANLPRDSKFHRNQVQCKHVDFLLCRPGTLEPQLAIELDDSSHKQPDNQARDEFKDNLLASIGLPLLRLEIQSGYSVHFLRQKINEKFEETEGLTDDRIPTVE